MPGIRLAVIGAICVSCGRERLLPDPRAYETVFHKEARERGWDAYPTTLEVKYEFIEGFSTEARCGFGDNTVTIDAETWEKASDTHREVLVFHELGHCLLMRNHRNECSLMNKDLVSDSDFIANRERLLDELFSMRGSLVIDEDAYKCND